MIKVVRNEEEPMVNVAFDNDTPDVVGVDRKGFVCLLCRHGKHECKHAKHVGKLMEEDVPLESLADMVQHATVLQAVHRCVYVKKTLSRGRIL